MSTSMLIRMNPALLGWHRGHLAARGYVQGWLLAHPWVLTDGGPEWRDRLDELRKVWKGRWACVCRGR